MKRQEKKFYKQSKTLDSFVAEFIRRQVLGYSHPVKYY